MVQRPGAPGIDEVSSLSTTFTRLSEHHGAPWSTTHEPLWATASALGNTFRSTQSRHPTLCKRFDNKFLSKEDITSKRIFPPKDLLIRCSNFHDEYMRFVVFFQMYIQFLIVEVYGRIQCVFCFLTVEGIVVLSTGWELYKFNYVGVGYFLILPELVTTPLHSPVVAVHHVSGEGPGSWCATEGSHHLSSVRKSWADSFSVPKNSISRLYTSDAFSRQFIGFLRRSKCAMEPCEFAKWRVQLRLRTAICSDVVCMCRCISTEHCE